MPRKPLESARREATPTIRITMFPAGAVTGRRHAPTRWWDGMPWILGLASAVLLLFATAAWPWWSGVVGHAMADFYYYQGREADRRGEAKVVVQRHYQRSVAADPGFNRARLDLARSYIDVGWYRGAIAQADGVIDNRKRSRTEVSLAYAYRGYCHYLLGDKAMGRTDLEIAIQRDPENALAQSILERLEEKDWLSPPEIQAIFRTLEGLKATPKIERF